MTFATLWNKPEYWFRPSQIVRKIRFALGSKGNASREVRVPWGASLVVRERDAIGRSLLTLGVYELAVSEILWRLTDRGEMCLDAGANLGYMTSLLSAKVGSTGRVFCFEPHPQVFDRLKHNVANLTNASAVTVYNEAIGATDGTAELAESIDFASNEGTASVIRSGEETSARVKHPVTIRRLDTIFSGAEDFGLMKVDVEGAELDVLRGAARLLGEHKIRDVVWEDHQPFPSESVQLLFEHGYRIFQFAKTLRGPRLWDPFVRRDKDGLPWEATNYLATIDPGRAESRLKVPGWRCLRGR